jgi:hypothetical protein
VWVDGDGNGRRAAPLAYAEKLAEESGNDPSRLVPLLALYDRSVALHSLDLLRGRGVNLLDSGIRAAFESGSSSAKAAYAQYMAEIKQVPSASN